MRKLFRKTKAHEKSQLKDLEPKFRGRIIKVQTHGSCDPVFLQELNNIAVETSATQPTRETFPEDCLLIWQWKPVIKGWPALCSDSAQSGRDHCCKRSFYPKLPQVLSQQNHVRSIGRSRRWGVSIIMGACTAPGKLLSSPKPQFLHLWFERAGGAILQRLFQPCNSVLFARELFANVLCSGLQLTVITGFKWREPRLLSQFNPPFLFSHATPDCFYIH